MKSLRHHTFYVTDSTSTRILLVYPSGTVILSGQRSPFSDLTFLSKFTLPKLHGVLRSALAWRLQIPSPKAQPTPLPAHFTLLCGGSVERIALCHKKIEPDEARRVLADFPALTAVACSRGFFRRPVAQEVLVEAEAQTA